MAFHTAIIPFFMQKTGQKAKKYKIFKKSQFYSQHFCLEMSLIYRQLFFIHEDNTSLKATY